MTITILKGDCRDVLKTLPDESAHCVVTSPPYWGLRDYGTAQWDGGDPGCDHIKGEMRRGINLAQSTASTRGGAIKCAEVSDISYGNVCGKCGARRVDSQIGLEQSPQEYVEQMVAAFREVRRVLRDDGTLWLNLGDSYATQGGRGEARMVELGSPSLAAITVAAARGSAPGTKMPIGLKPKDLCGIPWRVAFALQADGWYLRQDIIWSKPNPMPESVTDRCTKAHEYIFLLSKSAKYYYDAEAIKETASNPDRAVEKTYNRPNREEWAQGPMARGRDGFNHQFADPDRGWGSQGSRNKRSVWEIATAPFSEAHFATFPPALIEPCILAGCPEKCCAKCGAPWLRSTEYGRVLSTGGSDKGMRAQNMKGYDPCGTHSVDSAYNTGNMVQREKITTGFSPSCSCNADTVAGAVLDPFGGAGTTGLVADRLGRNAILIELNPEYAAMIERRIRSDAGMFAEVSA